LNAEENKMSEENNGQEFWIIDPENLTLNSYLGIELGTSGMGKYFPTLDKTLLIGYGCFSSKQAAMQVLKSSASKRFNYLMTELKKVQECFDQIVTEEEKLLLSRKING
jgi:hypothetical protein